MIRISQFILTLYLLVHAGDKKSENSLPVVEEEEYPQGYFSFPLSPGVTTSLSGSFGDIRINHFHAGLDIRTGGREGKSVYSAGPGYVSRIKVARGGYGNGLYITHPNGYTTVYGHLKEYAPEIKAYLTQKQYEAETWEIDLYLKPDEIPVKKGELVAISGNTGGSGGPHLHFEIRDEEENTLDPARFGFKEIKDNVAPVTEFVSLRCMSEDARINGQFGTFDFPVSLDANGDYRINRNIQVWGDIGIEIYAYDKAETSPFKLGIKKLDVRHNNLSTFYFELDKLAFDNKIDLNLHTNYERMVEENDKLHKGYFEPGNSMDLYEYDRNLGVLNCRQEGKDPVEISMEDTYSNKRLILFDLLVTKNGSASVPNGLGRYQEYEVKHYDSIIKLTRLKQNEELVLINNNGEKKIRAAYTNGREETFVFDLRSAFFTHFMHKGGLVKLPVTYLISPDKRQVEGDDFQLDFENSLYHPLFVNFENNGKQLLLDKDTRPLRGRFSVNWKPSLENSRTEKDKIYNVAGRRPNYLGGTWNGNSIEFRPKEFGTYQILHDDTPPVVETRSVSPGSLVFKISDALSGIASFECRVNGEWVLMEYEYKNGLLWSESLDSKPFSGEIVLRVTDNCNNLKTIKTKI